MDAVKMSIIANVTKSIADASKKADSASSTSDNFSNVLDQRMSTQAINNRSNQKAQKTAPDSTQSIKANTKTDQKQPSNASKAKDTSQSNSSNSTKDVKNTTVKESNTVDTANDVSEEVEEVDTTYDETIMAILAQIMSSLDSLKQMIQDKLGMSDEQFNTTLEELGMTTSDLFDSNNLKSFFLQAQGADASELLTNENLANDLSQLLAQMDDLKNLTMKDLSQDDVNKALELLDEMNQAPEETVVEQPKSQEKSHESIQEDFQENSSVSPSKVHDDVKADKKEEHESGKEQHTEQKNVTTDVKLIVNGSTDVTAQTKVEFFDQLSAATGKREIVEQLVSEIKVNISPEHTSMEMVLTPDTLGKVNLTVTTKNGVMTARMVTETQEAKEAIENQINVLKETLSKQGLKVDAVEVAVSANSFDFMNQSNMDGQKNQENTGKVDKKHSKFRSDSDIPEEESTVEETKQNVNASIGKGTQIDISA